MKNYFAFIDETGNTAQDRFFGLGMLLIEKVGPLYDAIKPLYDRARDLARLQKEKTINDLQVNKKYGEIAKIAKSSKRFELKFKMIGFTNNTVYRQIIRTYLKFPKCRFSAVVIDRKDPNFKPKEVFASPWYMYTSYAATLVAGDINNLSTCQVCVLADDLTKPKNISESFEDAIAKKVGLKLKKDGVSRSIFNIARLESHSSLMLQLVDVLLGCVVYDFKKESNLISPKLAERQETVVQELRENLKRKSLADHFTANKPSYFNVWKMKWKEK